MKVDIKPMIVGELTWDKSYDRPFCGLYFLCGYNGSEDTGLCYAVLQGPILVPVKRADGRYLRLEGLAGLSCRYNEQTGTIYDFTED